MKLHTDGTIEGTPEEVAAYKWEMYPKILLNEVKPEREVQYTAAKLEEIKRESANIMELTEEQVASLSTHRLVEELSNRTGVNHIPVNEDDVLKIQIANEAKLSVNQREDLFGSKYILIERG